MRCEQHVRCIVLSKIMNNATSATADRRLNRRKVDSGMRGNIARADIARITKKRRNNGESRSDAKGRDRHLRECRNRCETTEMIHHRIE
jgi:hypothetical protein